MFPDSMVSPEGDLVHLALLVDDEPIGFEDAMKEAMWREAMIEEFNVIERNQTWQPVDLQLHKQPIVVKWVFKVKHTPDGSVAKYKARIVAKGFLQRAGLDYSEVFAPVARLETVRLVVALASFKGW